jgi:cation diffusion facilitator CzcD-associated flavoprotein CzcO
MAKTYIDINPSENVVILEGKGSIGGVWSKEMLYADLKSNNLVGTFEYSDFPMDQATYGIKEGDHVPGDVIHQYLTDYSTRFDLTRRVLLNTKVTAIELLSDDSWSVSFGRGPAFAEADSLVTKRLVLATGMTSEPSKPYIKGQEAFGNDIHHFADFAKFKDELSSVKQVAILGAGKSAWDVAFAYAAAGVSVDWIIRKGGGPNWMAPARVTPFKLILEKLILRRALSWFSPCIWGDADGYGWIRSLLHGTLVGRWIVERFNAVLAADVVTLNGYDKHPETKKLKPWTSPFWVGSMFGILNHSGDFFDYVRNGTIKVHIADVDRLSPQTIHLSNGDEIHPDIFWLATGWDHSVNIKFLPKGIDRDLGLPYFSKDSDKLLAKADEQILNSFPLLRQQPKIRRYDFPTHDQANVSRPNRPFGLYRFLVPPKFVSKRNIGFAGMTTVFNVPMVAQAQALWLTAFLGAQIGLESVDIGELEWQAVLHNRFGRWRSPVSFAHTFPAFVFDCIPYIDLLLSDLQLRQHRKKNVLAEIFQPYGPEDYRGLVDEWKLKNV